MSEPIAPPRRPGASADLFHAVPLDILDPFLYAEVDDRRFAVNSVLERDRIEALGLGIEVLDPFELGMDELLNAGVGFLEAEIECDLRALPPDRASSTRSCRPTSRSRGPTGCARSGVELRVDADAFDLRRRVKTERPARRHPPRPGRRRRRDGRRGGGCCASCRPGLTCEQVREEMQRVCAEHDAELPETAIVAHGAQSAVGHEEGSGPIERGEVVLIDIWPRDKRLALLGRHDAHVRGRRRGAARRAAGVLGAHARLARRRQGRDPPRRGLPRAARALLRAVRGGGQADGAHEGAGHGAGGGLLPRPRARRRASRSTSARTSAAPTSG